jgi:hypothetical protein
MELTKLTSQTPDIVENLPPEMKPKPRGDGTRRGCLLLLGTMVILALIVIIGLLLIISSTAPATSRPSTSLLRVSTINLADVIAGNEKLESTFLNSLPSTVSNSTLTETFGSMLKELVPAIKEPNATVAYRLNLLSQSDKATTTIDIQGTADERGTKGLGHIYDASADPKAEFSYIYVSPLLYLRLDNLEDKTSPNARNISRFINKWILIDTSTYGTYADKVNGLPKIAAATLPDLRKSVFENHPLFSDPAIGDTAKVEDQNVSCLVYKINTQNLNSTLATFELPQMEVCSAENGYTPLQFKFTGTSNSTKTQLAIAIEGLSINPEPISPPAEEIIPLNELIAPV